MLHSIYILPSKNNLLLSWISPRRPKTTGATGILSPRASKRCILHWIPCDADHSLSSFEKYAEPTYNGYFVWNRVVTEGVESRDIVGYKVKEESKKLPVINKVSPFPTNGLIHFDPPKLSLPFVPKKQLVFSVNIVNNTDYCVGFNRYHPETNVGIYYIEPACGVMPPRSTQKLVVRRVPEKYERREMQCQDKLVMWSCLVSEAVEDSDILEDISYSESKELPIVYKKSADIARSQGIDFLSWSWMSKTSLPASDELIQLDPPQLPFDFLPNKRVSMLNLFNVVNVTDHNVGFNIWCHEDNSAKYVAQPNVGILPAQSTQAIKVRRTLKENVQEDMQCKDKIFMWNGIVTEGVEVSDICKYTEGGSKELPVVLRKPGESSSR